MNDPAPFPVKSPTAAQRFGGFAAAHTTYSLLCLIPLYLFAESSGRGFVGFVWTLPAVLILLYLPLGMFTAWIGKWGCPRTRQERGLAILLPVLVAWTWVLVVLISVIGEWETLFLSVFTVSILLAVPSSLFVITLMGLIFRLTEGEGSLAVVLGLCGLLSGFLPPLLFALGSFYQSKRVMGKGTVSDG